MVSPQKSRAFYGFVGTICQLNVRQSAGRKFRFPQSLQFFPACILHFSKESCMLPFFLIREKIGKAECPAVHKTTVGQTQFGNTGQRNIGHRHEGGIERNDRKKSFPDSDRILSASSVFCSGLCRTMDSVRKYIVTDPEPIPVFCFSILGFTGTVH